MSKELLYISGPMHGFPEFNFPAFEDAAGKLRAHGYRVISPHELGKVDSWSWPDYLRRDLLVLLGAGPTLTGVATLPDGPEFDRPPSRGMALETHVAAAFGLTVQSVNEWLAR